MKKHDLSTFQQGSRSPRVNREATSSRQRGFTLIELLIVIGIIAILAAIIYVAVDPVRRMREARNAERWSSVNSVLNAVLKYTVDNQGVLPTNLGTAYPGTHYVIGTGGAGACSNAGCTAVTNSIDCVDIDNSGELVDRYLASVPLDPSDGVATDTGYYIRKSAAGRITVGACDPEDPAGTGAPTISVTR